MLLRLFKILLRCGDLELPYVQLSPRADGTLSIPGVLFEFAPFPPHRGGRGGAGRGGAEAERRGRAPGTAPGLAVFTNTRHRQRGAAAPPAAPGGGAGAARSPRAGPAQPAGRRHHEALGARGTPGIRAGSGGERGAPVRRGGRHLRCYIILITLFSTEKTAIS